MLEIPCIYDDFNKSGFPYNYLVFKKGNSWGCIDDSGNEILPFIYEGIKCISKNFFSVRIGGKWKCVNLQQADILTYPYEDIKYLGGNFLGIFNNGKWSAYTVNGEEVISSSYDDIKFIELNCFAVKSEGLWGLVSTDEIGITEIKYDRIEKIYEKKYVEAYIGSTLKYLDSLGREYDEWYPDAMKYGFYLPKDKTYLIDKEGHPVPLVSGYIWKIEIYKHNLLDSRWRQEYDYYKSDELIRRYVNPWKEHFMVWVNYDPPLRDTPRDAYYWIYNPPCENQKAILFDSLNTYLQYSAIEGFKSNMIIPFIYAEATEAIAFFKDEQLCWGPVIITNGICDYLIVQKSDFSNNWGLVSCDKEIYPCKYAKDFIFISIDKLKIHEDNHYFIGNLNGKRISENYVSIEKKEDYLYCKLEPEHYHILDFDGNFQGEYIKGEFFDGKVMSTPYNVILRKITEDSCLIRNKGRYGLINQNGEVLVDCLYDTPIEFLGESYFSVQKNHLYGIINQDGEVLIDCLYDTPIEFLGESYFSVRKNHLYGIINLDGKILIDCLYDTPLKCIGGLYFQTQTNKLHGIINVRNEIILPFNYKNIKSLNDGILAIQDIEDKWGFINKCGHLISSCQYVDFKNCNCQNNVVIKVRKIPYRKYQDCYRFMDNFDGGIDLLNADGVSILKNNYLYIKDFYYDMAAVQGVDGLWGYIDSKGNEVIPLIYYQVDNSPHYFERTKMKPSPQLLFGVSLKGRYFCIDKEQVEYKKSWLGEFSQDQLLYSKLESIKRKYHEIVDERNCYNFRYELEGMDEYLKPFETITIVCQYTAPNSYNKKPLFGLLDAVGDERQPCQYTCMRKKGKYIYVKKNNLWGTLDEYGREIIKCKYDSIEEFENNLARIKKNNLVGLINTDGQELISCKYNAISDLIGGKYRIVCLNEKYNLLDEYGNELFEWKYDYIYSLLDGKAIVELRKYFNPKHPYLHLEDWSLFNEWRRNTWKIERYGKNELAYKCIYGVINVKGKEELACIYDNGDDEACHEIKNNNRGFVMLGSVDIDISHSDKFLGTENGCIFRVGGKYGFKKMKRAIGYYNWEKCWRFKCNKKE